MTGKRWPRRSPTRTSPDRERAVLEARTRLRFGPARLSAETGVAARTISRILVRHRIPPLAWLDPATGTVSAEVSHLIDVDAR